jgi:hypothetical protein
MRNGWQIVLKAGTLCLIESDVDPSVTPPPGATFLPPVFTPSRKYAHCASAEDSLALPSFTMSGMPGTLTPAPTKKTRWADNPAPLFTSPLHLLSPEGGVPPAVVLHLLDLLSEVLVSKALKPGSLAKMLSPAALSQLLRLLGEHLPGVGSGVTVASAPAPLPFSGPPCPKCLPQGIYHVLDTFCPSARTTWPPQKGSTAKAVQPAGRLPKPMSYALAAAVAAPGKPVRGGVAALAAPPHVGPSATTRSVRQCSKQGTKLTRVIFRPHPIFAGIPPPIDAVFAALESFRPHLKAAEYTL